VSALGSSVTRYQNQMVDAAARKRVEEDAAEQRKQIAELEAKVTRQQALSDTHLALAPAIRGEESAHAGMTKLAASLRTLTKATMVTIFSVPSGFSEASDVRLTVAFNDFAMHNQAIARPLPPPQSQPVDSARRPAESKVRSGEGAASTDQLPHQGFARRAASKMLAERCDQPSAQPKSVFDGALEATVGFKSECVLVLPVVHDGHALGVLQLTNKQVATVTDVKPTARTAHGLLFGRPDGSQNPDVVAPATAKVASHFTAGDESAAGHLVAQAALLLLRLQDGLNELPPVRTAEPLSPPSSTGFRGTLNSKGVPRREATTPARRPVLAGPIEDATHAQSPKAKSPPPQRPVQPRAPTLDGGLLEVVFSITQELSSAHAMRSLLSTALHSVTKLVAAQYASIFLTGEDDGSMLRVGLVQDELGKAGLTADLEVAKIIDVRLGIVGGVVTTGQAANIIDTASASAFDPSVDCAPGYVVRSVLCTPIVGSHHQVMGAVELCNRLPNGGKFGPKDESALAVFTALLAAPLERARVLAGFERAF